MVADHGHLHQTKAAFCIGVPWDCVLCAACLAATSGSQLALLSLCTLRPDSKVEAQMKTYMYFCTCVLCAALKYLLIALNVPTEVPKGGVGRASLGQQGTSERYGVNDWNS